MKEIKVTQKRVGPDTVWVHFFKHQDPEYYEIKVVHGIPEKKTRSRIYKTYRNAIRAYRRLSKYPDPERLIKNLNNNH